jgi:hypothetical protein
MNVSVSFLHLFLFQRLPKDNKIPPEKDPIIEPIIIVCNNVDDGILE